MLYIFNAIVLLWIGVMWSKSDWLNLSIKLILIGMFLANTFYTLQAYGWIVRAV